MKLYIFITVDIHPIGGMQLYTAGKVEYLESKGWKVIVFHPGTSAGKCKYTILDAHLKYNVPLFHFAPQSLSAHERERTLTYVKKFIPKDYEDICIESQHDIGALWGEMLAKELRGKHVCFCCNEQFRGTNKVYDKFIDFFWFKYNRGELFGIRPEFAHKLFYGFYSVDENSSKVFDAAEPNPVQNVSDSQINLLGKTDYTIMYLGRAEKGYVPNIVKGVADFSRRHGDKSIQFVIVGNAKKRKKLLREQLAGINNVRIKLMGDMVPIPREIFSKVDVVIAGSGCAEAAAREKVPTIVADCDNYLANGVLGYTVNNIFSQERCNQTDFFCALEDVLIKKEYLKHPYTFPETGSVSEIYNLHMDLVNSSSKLLEYFDFASVPKVQKRFGEYVWSYVKICFPSLAERMKKIKNGLG